MPDEDIIFTSYETEPDDIGDATKVIPFSPAEVQDDE